MGAALTATLAGGSAGLGTAAVHLAQAAVGPDDAVAVVVLGIGALAAGLLAAGTALTSASAAARLAGHTWWAVERIAAALTPRVLRRALVLGLGASLVAGPAVADEPPDLGWQLTGSTAQAPLASTQPAPPVDRSASAVIEPATVLPASATGPAVDPLAAVDLPAAPATAAPAAPTVVVAPGDCLWSIAAAHLSPGASDTEIAAAWPSWYAANQEVIGPDPDLIEPGQLLVVPQVPAR